MEFNINDLERYDLKNAKVNDNVIYFHTHWGGVINFKVCKIKSVSQGRGDVTLDNKVRLDSNGRVIGGMPYDMSCTVILAYNKQNASKVKNYIKHIRFAREIKKIIGDLPFDKLANMTIDKLEKIHGWLKDMEVEG